MIVRTPLHWLAKLSLLPFLLSGFAVYAQYSGNIQGIVSDPAGGVVSGASIQLRNVDTGVIAPRKKLTSWKTISTAGKLSQADHTGERAVSSSKQTNG